MAKSREFKKPSNGNTIGKPQTRFHVGDDDNFFEEDEPYIVKFLGCDKMESAQFGGHYFLFKFQALGGRMENGKPAKGKQCAAFASIPMSGIGPNSKLGKTLASITGKRILDPDTDVDLKQYIGKKYRVIIGEAQSNSDTRKQKITSIKIYKPKPK